MIFYSKSLMISISCNSRHFSDFNIFQTACQIGKKKKLWAGKSEGYVSSLQLEKVKQTKLIDTAQEHGKVLEKLCHACTLNDMDFLKLTQKYVYFWSKELFLFESFKINIRFNMESLTFSKMQQST